MIHGLLERGSLQSASTDFVQVSVARGPQDGVTLEITSITGSGPGAVRRVRTLPDAAMVLGNLLSRCGHSIRFHQAAKCRGPR